MKLFEKNTSSPIETPLGEKPQFYLIYLLFYFFPWIFKTPSANDILAAVMAIALFVPIYLHGASQAGALRLVNISAILLISFAVSPFFGSHGVFLIYAMALAGFLENERHAWITLVALVLSYGLFSWLTHQEWWDWGFPIFIGTMTAIGSIATSRRAYQADQMHREQELKRQLATESERERISQDLHDLLGQTLTMVALKSEVAEKLFDRNPEQAKQEIVEIRKAARIALKDVREAVAGMNVTNLAAELKRAKSILTSAKVRFSIIGELPILNSKADQVLGLAFREAVTNIVRHSNANHVTLNLMRSQTGMQILIFDNGHGNTVIEEGSGLTGLRKRVSKLGGETTIGNMRFKQKNGFGVTIELPSNAIQESQSNDSYSRAPT